MNFLNVVILSPEEDLCDMECSTLYSMLSFECVCMCVCVGGGGGGGGLHSITCLYIVNVSYKI